MKNPLLLCLVCLVPLAARAATPPGAITMAVIGPADPNGKVPVINGVPGSGVTNLAVPFPGLYLTHGGGYSITIASQNFAFAGSCVTSYVLKAVVSGVSKVISHGKTKPYNCGTETLWAWVWNTPAIPNDPGPATLVASVEFGTTVVKKSVALTIQ